MQRPGSSRAILPSAQELDSLTCARGDDGEGLSNLSITSRAAAAQPQPRSSARETVGDLQPNSHESPESLRFVEFLESPASSEPYEEPSFHESLESLSLLSFLSLPRLLSLMKNLILMSLLSL